MSETAQFALPLVQAAQAQKHVTVNEALARLDAVAQLRVVAATVATPPVSASEGQAWIVPTGATGVWATKIGQIAVWANGNWVYLVAKAGWRAWDQTSKAHRMFDGVNWTADALTVAPGGAAMQWKTVEFDHTIVAGATSTTTAIIPASAQVIGVTGRVITAIVGAATTWRLGVTGFDDRYGSLLGKALNSFAKGLTSAPVTYYVATPLLLTGTGGNFTSGVVRFAVNYVELVPPRSV